jgi:hypothetical protein
MDISDTRKVIAPGWRLPLIFVIVAFVPYLLEPRQALTGARGERGSTGGTFTS